MSRRPLVFAPLIAALATGCFAPPVPKIGGPIGTNPKVSVATPKPAATGATWVRDAAEGSLIGKIRGPVGLISDHGSGVISNNGSSVVANQGGRLRLTAVEEVAAAGVTVRLLGADGKPYLDAAGKAFEAVTDAQGAYAFAGFVPTRNFVVAVDLPGGKGRLSALAVKAAGDRLVVDVDLASTVTAAWVLDRLLANQADPAATLDRLTAAAEADARTQAAAAVQARTEALPATLDGAAAATLADALRQASTGFDAGLTTIERLLVPGGQRGLGEGLPATEVALGLVRHLAMSPKGTAFLACPADGKIWKVGADGKLVTAAGKGVGEAEAAVDGRPGAEVALGGVLAMVPDGEDGLLFLEKGPAGPRLIRIKDDGTLASAGTLAGLPLQTGLGALLGTTAQAGMARVPGGVLVLAAPARGAAQAWLVPTGEAPRLAHTFDDAATASIRGFTRMGGGPGGAFVGLAVPQPAKAGVRTTDLYSLDPATFAVRLVQAQDPEAIALTVDGLGRPVRQTADRSLGMLGFPARGLPALGPLGVVYPIGNVVDLQLPPDLLIAAGDVVYRVKGGVATPFAGLVDPPAEVPAAKLGLRDPIALAADPAGRQYIYDDGNRAVWKIDLDGVARRLAVLPESLDGTPLGVTALRVAGDRLLLIDDAENGGTIHRLLELGPTGAPRTLLTLTGKWEAVWDVGPAPAGGLYVLAHEGELAHVLMLDAAGAVQARHEVSDEHERLAVGPDARVWLASGDGLASWTPAGGEAVVEVPEAWWDLWDSDTWIAADARGRIYGSGADMWRFDPATDVVAPLAREAGSVDTEITAWAKFPALLASGDLLYLEQSYRQVRLVKAADLD